MSPRRGIRRVLTHFYSDSISVRATRRPKGRRGALENGGGGGGPTSPRRIYDTSERSEADEEYERGRDQGSRKGVSAREPVA